MKSDIEKGVIVSKEAVLNVEKLLADVPQSTDGELRKLLSVQGAILNQIGLELIMSATNSKKKASLLRLAFQALDGSRNSLIAAGKIRVNGGIEEEVEEVDGAE